MQGSVLGGWSFHLLDEAASCTSTTWPAGALPGRGLGHLPVGSATTRCPALRPAHRGAPGRRRGRGHGRGRRTAWSRFSLTGAGLTAGWSPDLSPADEDYRGRFAFTGTLHRVEIDVQGTPVVDPEIEAQEAIARQ